MSLNVKNFFERNRFAITKLVLHGIELDKESFAHLNLLLYLYELELAGISFNSNPDEDSEVKFNIKMGFLRRLKLIDCDSKILSAFDNLKKDILNEIHIEDKTNKLRSLKSFQNQGHVTKMYLRGEAYAMIDFDSFTLRLSYLDIDCTPCIKLLNTQTRLSTLKVDCVVNKVRLVRITKKLENLHQFEFKLHIDDNIPIDLSSLQYLKYLKKLKITMLSDNQAKQQAIDGSCMTLRSNSLQELNVSYPDFDLSEANVSRLAAGCPNILKISIKSRSSTTLVNLILQYFPGSTSLEVELEYDSRLSKIIHSGGFEHHSLKFLRVDCYPGLDFLLKEKVKISQLETFTAFIDGKFDGKSLEKILRCYPTLKYLYLRSEFVIGLDFIAVLKIFGKNLEGFKLISHKVVNKKLENVFEELQDQFPAHDFNRNHGTLLMKKHSAVAMKPMSWPNFSH